MYKLKMILESTVTKVVSLVLIISFVISVFLFYDFYRRQIDKVKGCYWIYKGDKCFKEGDLQNAIYLYHRGIKLYPNHYRALYNLANIYVVYEDYYQALENYKRALEIKPDFEVARIDYAIILSETYNTDEAIEQYQKVVKNKRAVVTLPFVNPNSRFKRIHVPFSYERKKTYEHNVGIAYYNMGRAYRTKSLLAGLDPKMSIRYLDKAGMSYKEAVEVLKSYNSNYNLGLINQLLKDKRQAGYYYCKAIELAPMEYEAHFNLAVLLNDMGKIDGSAQEFTKAGLILDSKGEGVKTQYIYNILDEVNKKIAIRQQDNKEKNENIKEKLNNIDKKEKKKKKKKTKKDVYKAGKLVIDDSDEIDEDMLEFFKTCSNKELFMGMEEKNED